MADDRPATAGDIPAILSIWNPVIRDTAITFTSAEKTPDDIARMLADKAAAGLAFLVADHDGAVGFATCGPFRSGPGYARAMEHTILLSPAAWGRGIGRALVAAVGDHARGAGVHTMLAGVGGGNAAGIAFHRAVGFAEVARIPEVGWKFGRWHDLVLMQKFL